MTRRLTSVAACALALACGAGFARADGNDVASALAEAQGALAAGDSERAAALAAPVATAPGTLEPGDRAEAWRLYGLSLFFLGRKEEAAGALFEFLKLDPDAALDPALVPPEAILFFEEVRVRHAAEIRASRPRPEVPRYVWLNLLPAGGQFQNGERTKGWIVAGASTATLGASVASYFLLRANCRRTEDGPGCENIGAARTMRALNVASVIAFAGLYTYSVVDGFAGYRRRVREAAAWEREQARMSVGVGASPDGGYLSLSGRF